MAQLVRRYLEAFGPASEADIARFAELARAPVRATLAAMANGLSRYTGPDGTLLHDVPDGAVPPEDTPAPPRLMAMWDSTLLVYEDRSRILPAVYQPLVIRSNGDTLPTILVDGHVAGVWRPTDGGIEITAFHQLDDAARAGLAGEAVSLIRFLAPRQPGVYGRYGRWWTDLPAAEVRTLAG